MTITRKSSLLRRPVRRNEEGPGISSLPLKASPVGVLTPIAVNSLVHCMAGRARQFAASPVGCTLGDLQTAASFETITRVIGGTTDGRYTTDTR